MKKSFVSLVVPMVIIMALIAAYMIPSVALAAKPEDIIDDLYDNGTFIMVPIPGGYYGLRIGTPDHEGYVDVDGKVIVPAGESGSYSSIKITLKGYKGYDGDRPGRYSGSGTIFQSCPDGGLMVDYDWKLTVGSNGSVRFTAQANNL